MKRALIAALIVACATVATAAEAAVSSGSFTGRTAAKDPIGVTVGGGSRITRMYFEKVHMKCSNKEYDYDTPSGADRMEAKGRRVKIHSDGKWTLKVSKRHGAMTWTASGRFSGSGARTSGRLRVRATYDTEFFPDVSGNIYCDGGKVKFTARR